MPPSPLYISRPPAGFSALAVVRGLQLTFLGAVRALRNPYLIKSGYYRRALHAIAISMGIQVVLWMPIWILRFFVWCLMLIASESALEYLKDVIDTLEFIENNVLNVGLFLVSAVRFFQPEMDDMFLFSLQFVDGVYKKKHPESTRQYYDTLLQYHGADLKSMTDDASIRSEKTGATGGVKPKKNWIEEIKSLYYNNKAFGVFLKKYFMRSAFSLGIFMLSGFPIIGHLVMPAFSFYSFNKVVGTPTALAIFAVGLAVEKKYMVMFISTFWGGRSLVRGLLNPYFSRVPFSRAERDQWFKAREGIMFGFGCGFYWIMKIPFIGVLVYGIAEASSAYLITKVSEPLPSPGPELVNWVAQELDWTKQKKFLSGITLDTDGFGDAPNIVPGSWAS